MLTLIYFILMLGIIVFIHELGHFIWAKKSGVYCYEFSLGFGPKLFSFKRKNDETLYCLRLIPVGGYVAMAGEEVDDDKTVPKDKKMYNKPWYKKLIIVLAGVTNNFILGFVVLFIMALCYGSLTNKPIIGEVEKNSASYKAGMKTGDEILKINGKRTKTWDDVTLTLVLGDNTKSQKLLVRQKDGKTKTVNVKPKKMKDKKGNVSYAYGMGLDTTKHYGLKNAFTYATSKFGSTFNSMIVTIKALFTGKIGVSALSGPVGIYKVTSQVRESGSITTLLYLVAMLSVNIGIFNLLPIPGLDGYQAILSLIEGIIHREVPVKVKYALQVLGLALVFGLMIAVTYQDLLRLFQ